MSTQKRPAVDPLPEPPAKQPRHTLFGPSGEKASPSQSLSSRWKGIATSLYYLVGDTISSVLRGKYGCIDSVSPQLLILVQAPQKPDLLPEARQEPKEAQYQAQDMPPSPSPSQKNAEAGPSRLHVESRQSSVAESLSIVGDGWREKYSVGQRGRDSQSPFQFSQNSSFHGSVSSQGHPRFQFKSYQASPIPSNFRDTPLRKPRRRSPRRKGSMGPPSRPPGP